MKKRVIFLISIVLLLLGCSSKTDNRFSRVEVSNEPISFYPYLVSDCDNRNAHDKWVKYYYDEIGRVREKQIGNCRLNIVYDANILVTKESIQDIKYLINLGKSVLTPLQMDIEYHEEYDELGRKVFAYAGGKERKNRSMAYFYDNEGRLYAKTIIHYGAGRVNSTIYYKKDGTVDHVNQEKYKALKARYKNFRKMKIEIGSQKAHKIMDAKLRHILF